MAKRAVHGTAMDMEILTLEEVASYLRLSRKTAYRMARSGELPAFKASNHWRIRRPELETWIQQRTKSGYSA
jgi:excisionase family DNA binding protein